MLGATAALVPALARAAPPVLRVGMDYDDRAAPSDCPSRMQLQEAIARQLGYDPFVAEGQQRELVVHVQMQRGGVGGTEATIEWLSTNGALEGERRLASESEQCSEIASGVVFAVAVQLELRAASAAAPPDPPSPPPAPPKEAAKKAPSSAARAVLAGAGALVEHGLQPGVAAGFRTFGALRGRAWSLGLDARGTLPTRWHTPEGAGFSANLLGLAVTPCLRASALDICALATVAQLSVRGEGVDRVRSPSAAIVGVGLRLQLAWPELDQLATLVHVDAWAPLTPRDVLVNHENVWSTAPIAFAAGFDVAAIFR